MVFEHFGWTSRINRDSCGVSLSLGSFGRGVSFFIWEPALTLGRVVTIYNLPRGTILVNMCSNFYVQILAGVRGPFALSRRGGKWHGVLLVLVEFCPVE